MAHALGGLLDLPHGECNALLLPHVVRYNYDAAPARFRAVGEALGADSKALDGDGAREVV